MENNILQCPQRDIRLFGPQLSFVYECQEMCETKYKYAIKILIGRDETSILTLSHIIGEHYVAP